LANFGEGNNRGTFISYNSSLSVSDPSSPQKKRNTVRVDKAREVKDFLFNDLTAKKLQEFELTKINNKGKRQRRIFGIDGYAVYNDKVPNRQKSDRYKLLKKLFKSSEVKRSSRPLVSIKEVTRKNDKSFVVSFKDENKDKSITYECDTTDQCSEILAKFEYLLKNNR
jgi:hypothetical protein